jgi:hypothetical protein
VNPGYLVGDVFPYTADTVGGFADGNLNILDLVQVLFSVNNVTGFKPAACSDRFDAMDLYPVDTPEQRGGDGALDIRDLIRELFRVNNLDPARPARTPLGGSCAGGSSLSSKLSASTGRDISRSSLRPAGTLILGEPQKSSAGERIPVYLRAGRDLYRVALTFALGDRRTPLRYEAAGAAPSLVQDSQPGVVALAWLDGVTLRAGEQALLGYIAAPSGAGATIGAFGASAVAMDDGAEIGIQFEEGRRK